MNEPRQIPTGRGEGTRLFDIYIYIYTENKYTLTNLPWKVIKLFNDDQSIGSGRNVHVVRRFFDKAFNPRIHF